MIYLFDRAKKLQKIIPRKHIINANPTVVRNGIYQLAVEVPLFYEDKKGTQYNYQKSVGKATFAGYYDIKKRFQLYKIYSRNINANDQGEILLFDGVHIFFDEAKAMGNIHDRRFRDSEAKAPADAAFNSIGWTVIDYDVTDRHDINFYRASVTDAWNDLISTYGVEFDYELQFDGRKIISKNIIMKKQIGKWTGQRFAYGTNVLTLTQEQDESEVYTAAVGRGRGEESGDGFGPRLEFGDIAWSKDGITKPVGQNYIELPSATAEYGFIENGILKPRIAPEVVFEDIEDKKKLADSTYYWLLENCVPKATWKTEVARIGNLSLGDTVGVLYKAAGIIKRARVEKIEYNLLDPELSKLTLGDFHHFENRQMKRINAEIKRLGRDNRSLITQVKDEFDQQFYAWVTAFKNEFEQAKIDIFAQVEADRVNMEALLNTKLTEFNTAFNADMEEAYRLANENYGIIRDEITDKVDTTRINLESKITDAVALWEAQAILDYNALDERITSDIDRARLDMELYTTQAAEHALEQAEVKATELTNAVKTELEDVTDVHANILKGLESNVLDIDKYLGSAREITLDQRLLDMTQTFDERIKSVREGNYNMIRGTSLDESAIIYLNGMDLITSERINYVSAWSNSGFPYLRFLENITLESGKQYTLSFDYRTDKVPEMDVVRIRRIDGTWYHIRDIENYDEANIYELVMDNTWHRAYIRFTPTENITGQLDIGTDYLAGSTTRGILDIRLPYLTQTGRTQWLFHPLDTTQNVEEVSRRLTQLEDGYSEMIVRSEWDAEMNSLNQTIRNYQTTVDGVEDTIIQLQDSEVITRGREVLDTVDGFQRKVWMGDIERPNLLPHTTFNNRENRDKWGAWGRYGYTYGGVFEDYAIVGDSNSSNSLGIISPDVGEYIEVGKQYTLTWEASTHYPQTTSIDFQYMYLTNIGDTNYSHNLPNPEYERISTGANAVYRKYKLTFTAPEGINPNTQILFGTNTNESNIDAFFRFRHPKLEEGAVASPFKTSFSMLEQRADEISLAVQGLDFTGMLTQSDIRVEPGYVQLGSQRLGDSQLASIFRVSPNSIDAITERMTLNGDLYVDGDITALAVSAINASFSDLFAARVRAGSVHADYVEGFSARFASLYTLNANIERLVSQYVFTDAVKTKSLEAVDANIGSLRTSILTSNVIKSGHVDSKVISAEHIVVDNTLVNLITARSVFADAITTKTLDAINANIGSIRTAILTANVITSDHIQVGTALVGKMFATSARIDQLLTKHHFVNNVKALSIEAVEGQFSTLFTRYLSANYIDVDYVNGKNAWFETQYVKTANISNLTSRSAFIRDIQAIEVTANQLNIQTLHSKLAGTEGGLTIYGPDGRVLINNSVLRASFDVQIFDSYAGSGVDFGGLNFVTSSSFWQTFKYFYTDFKGSQLLISWAVGMQSGNSSSEYAEVRVRGFGGSSNPITTRSSRQLVRVGETTYHNQIITLGVPNYNTIQAYLEFRRSPTGTHIDNRVTARILRVSMIN